MTVALSQLLFSYNLIHLNSIFMLISIRFKCQKNIISSYIIVQFRYFSKVLNEAGAPLTNVISVAAPCGCKRNCNSCTSFLYRIELLY